MSSPQFFIILDESNRQAWGPDGWVTWTAGQSATIMCYDTQDEALTDLNNLNTKRDAKVVEYNRE